MTHPAYARFIRTMIPHLVALAAELERDQDIAPNDRSAQGKPPAKAASRASEADQDAARMRDGRLPTQSIPPGSAAESTLPPGMIVIRGTGHVVDEAALRADWLTLSTADIIAKHKISEPTLYALRKRLALPDRPKGPRHAKPANGVRRISAAWAQPEIGGGNFVPTPAPRKDTGLPPAPFDDTRVSSAEPLIQFLRGRDVIVARLPDGKFRIDGRRNVDLAGLLALANDKRALMKKPPFTMEA